MNNLYLVTTNGDRHEDHVPIGFFDYCDLQIRYGVKLSKQELDAGYGWSWHRDKDVDINIIPVRANILIPST